MKLERALRFASRPLRDCDFQNRKTAARLANLTILHLKRGTYFRPIQVQVLSF